MSTWIPDSCTLPTVERPLRSREFDRLFRSDLRAVHRFDAATLLLAFESRAGLHDRVADLAARESGCCSFFSFELEEASGRLELRVRVGPGHLDVLDGLEGRAKSLVSEPSR